MKWIFIILVPLVSNVLTSKAQSVGINTTGTAPTDTKAMLEVLRPGFSKIKIRTENYSSDTSMLEFTNRKVSGTGGDFRMSMINQDGMFFTSASDFAGNTNDSLLAIRLNGNVGIGINNPAYKLHLNTPLSANNFLSITTNTTGVSANDGMILGMVGNSARLGNLETGDLRFGTSNSTRVLIDASGNVGINNSTPLYKLDVGGDINMTGALRVNGATGQMGQVITSNGASAPTWQDQAFSNDVRFSVRLRQSLVSAGNDCNISFTDYNLSPSDISIGTTSLTINKTGLYHFDMELHGTVDYVSASNIYYPFFGLTFYCGPINGYSIIDNRVMSSTSTSNTRWGFEGSGSIDIYITAPATIRVAHGLGALGTPAMSSYSAAGYLVGYLIKE